MRPENRAISKSRRKVEIAQRALVDAADIYEEEADAGEEDSGSQAFRIAKESVEELLSAIDAVIERYESDFI